MGRERSQARLSSTARRITSTCVMEVAVAEKNDKKKLVAAVATTDAATGKVSEAPITTD